MKIAKLSEIPAREERSPQRNYHLLRQSIFQTLGGGTVIGTTKETKGDKTYYEAEVQKSGGEKVEINFR
jgi:hypothetical protein